MTARFQFLLEKFQPLLRYDSMESYFADSAAEWTDEKNNELRQAHPDADSDGLIASHDTQPKLSLELLGQRAGDGSEDEYVGSSVKHYRGRYEKLRSEHYGEYANVIYARAAAGGDGRLWLQYWFWYFYNDYNLAHQIGLHEGDWEMIQLQLDGLPDERATQEELDRLEPEIVVYAQHTHAEELSWGEVERAEGRPNTPLVYVARGSHASYFEKGLHETDVWYDIADGKREPKNPLRLEFLDGLAWSRWRGRWGDSPKRPGKVKHLVDQPSPEGPCEHSQWEDPAALRGTADIHRVHKKVGRRPPPVSTHRRWGRLRVGYTRRAGDPKADTIQINVNSQDEATRPPRTYTFEVRWADRATFHTSIPLSWRKSYDLYVAASFDEKHATATELRRIGRLVSIPDPKHAIRFFWPLGNWVRRTFGRRERPGSGP